MKLITFILLVGSLHVSAHGNAQKVTLIATKISLPKALNQIKKQTGYSILWNDQLIAAAPLISVNLRNVSITEALDQCLKGLSFTYEINGEFVYIKPKKEEEEHPVKLNVPPPPPVIKGHVTNEKGNALAGVSVTIKGTKKGTSTDDDGNFILENEEKNVTIEISSVGYESRSYKISATTGNIHVILKEKVTELDETVVIGYGTSRKKDLTGSVSSIAAADIQDIPFTTVDNALAGKAAGVQVTKTDGTPGGAVRIRVRGSTSLLGGNDPLYVIDGVPVQVQSDYISPGYDVSSPVGNDVTGAGGVNAGMSTAFVNGLNSLGGLNIDDIESITILKDASATSIYGSKAANGVVMITTKKGKKDTKPQITFNYYSTVTTIDRKPKVLNATQYKTLLTEAAQNDNAARDLAGMAHRSQADQIVNNPSGFFGSANTNWIDLVTRNTFANNAEISVQGGGPASRYYTSIAFNSTPGIVTGTSYQRVSGKINLENEISTHFKFITNLNLGYTNQDITNGAYGQALRARPDYTPYDSTGNYTNFADVGYSYQGFQNPLALTSAINNSKTTRLLGSVSAVYDFNPYLQFKSTVSLNSQTYNQRLYTPSYLQIGSFYGNVSSNGGIGSNANSRFTDWFIENTLGYTKELNEKNSVNILVGTSYETQKTSSFSATASGYPNDNVLNNLSSAITPLYTRGDDPDKPQSYLVSYYLRANYTYMSKYLFTLTGRADGSSKFGPDNKFGYFPSGAIAWRISKENFLKNVQWIDDIKIRASYGLTGNQNIGDQMYRTLYSPLSYAGSNALVPTQLGNPAIKWETTKQTDIGLDFSLFRNRLQGTFDYYKKQTDDDLLSLPLPPSSSYSSLLGNVVSIRNSGVELSLQGDIIRTNNFRWNASVNITWNKSLVTKISSNADLTQIGDLTGLEYGNTSIIQGQPLGLITGMKVTGIIKTQQELDAYKKKLGLFAGLVFPYLGIGDPMFLLDTVSYAAYGASYPLFNTVIANGAPKYFGGFTQGFSYKNFDLNLYFLFSEGGKLMWGDNVSSLTFVGTSNANAVMLNRYTPTNTNTNQPRLLLGDQLLYNTNLSVFNSSYLKLRTVTLNYRFNKSEWMKKTGIQSAAVYLSATNLFTITKYPGNDPETSDDAYSVAGGYFDVSNYPAVKTFSAGLKVGF
jgi:TonB-linked SusC/RagA family outer membrane protein